MTRLDALHPLKDHDRTPLDVPALTFIALGLLGGLLVIFVTLYFVFGHLMRSTAPRAANGIHDQSQSFTPQPLQPNPNHPELPWQDWANVQGQQLRRLNSYGPGDSAGTARIPIDRAMALALRNQIFAALPQAETRP
jgi:hypothetical protein